MTDETQPGGPVEPWGPPDAAPPDAAPPTPPSATAPPPAAPIAPWPDPTSAPAAPPPGPPVAWAAAPAVQPGIEVPGSPGIYFASVWARFAAFIVDGLIIGLINLVFTLILGAIFGSARSLSAANTPFGSIPQPNPAVVALTAVIGLIVSYTYLTTQWRGKYRATFGMRTFSIQLGNAFDGAPLTSRQATLRWAGLGQPLGLLSILSSTAWIGVVLLLLLELALFLTTLGSTTRQGWHDQLANSAVIRRPGTSGSNSGAIAIVVIVLVLGGIAVLGIVSLILLGGAISNILSEVGSSL